MISKDAAMAEKTKKVTIMVLKVDLECSKCYKKVKRILCKFPQIQDQVYEEKSNTVMIKVVCCSPEKIRDEIRYKGRGSIKSIEIFKPPEKPKAADPPKPADKPKAADPPKPADKPKAADPPKPAEKPKAADPAKPAEKPKADPPKPSDPPKEKPAEKATKVVTFVDVPKPTAAAPAMTYPPGPVPIGFYCTECRGGGPERYCDGYCGRPVYDSWGGGGSRPHYGSHYSEHYFNEDNSQGCTIM
ncbi:hypothetical protein LWI28_000398 [Acer negundo]|uniref:Uncharacterized protein n=1 Tax=Acer negundo TaxID=4023 RepID=A0AAD5JSU8_ACENE|nr:hypothetical protein LWI28_000398 [Acer negundo]KAK4850340.1 hypothetical protein QYF36_005874 [Acer negundo]